MVKHIKKSSTIKYKIYAILLQKAVKFDNFCIFTVLLNRESMLLYGEVKNFQGAQVLY